MKLSEILPAQTVSQMKATHIALQAQKALVKRNMQIEYREIFNISYELLLEVPDVHYTDVADYFAMEKNYDHK